MTLSITVENLCVQHKNWLRRPGGRLNEDTKWGAKTVNFKARWVFSGGDYGASARKAMIGKSDSCNSGASSETFQRKRVQIKLYELFRNSSVRCRASPQKYGNWYLNSIWCSPTKGSGKKLRRERMKNAVNVLSSEEGRRRGWRAKVIKSVIVTWRRNRIKSNFANPNNVWAAENQTPIKMIQNVLPRETRQGSAFLFYEKCFGSCYRVEREIMQNFFSFLLPAQPPNRRTLFA